MIAHASLHVTNLEKSTAFYRAVLSQLGYRNNMQYTEAAGFNDGANTDFWILKQSSTVVPTHVAFIARDQDQVQAFHKSALAAGGTNNGDPGYRHYSPGYFAAFALDLDGNNVEAVWYDRSLEQ